MRRRLTEERPLTTQLPAAPARGDVPAPTARGEHRAAWWDVLEAARDGVPLLDVRTPAEYRGPLRDRARLPRRTRTAPRPDPTAVNVPWSDATDPDGCFLPIEQLRSRYADGGVTAEHPVIAYCRIGERSAPAWFVLRELLGHPRARNYDGSWTEWGSMVGMPVAPSPSPGALTGHVGLQPALVGLRAR